MRSERLKTRGMRGLSLSSPLVAKLVPRTRRVAIRACCDVVGSECERGERKSDDELASGFVRQWREEGRHESSAVEGRVSMQGGNSGGNAAVHSLPQNREPSPSLPVLAVAELWSKLRVAKREKRGMRGAQLYKEGIRGETDRRIRISFNSACAEGQKSAPNRAATTGICSPSGNRQHLR